MEDMEYVDVEVIMMPQDDGTEVECTILAEFSLEGRDYMVLAPTVDGVMSGNLQYYRVEEEDEELSMEEVEDEDELFRVRDAFLKR